MTGLAVGKTMTIKELADALGVSRDLIEKRVNELFPQLMRKGVKTLLTEEHATAVKLRISENSSLATSDDRRRLVELPKTDLERKLIVRQALNILTEEVDELKQKIQEDKPKVDFFEQVTNSKDAIDIGSAAKVLNIKGMGRNNLLKPCEI